MCELFGFEKSEPILQELQDVFFAFSFCIILIKKKQENVSQLKLCLYNEPVRYVVVQQGSSHYDRQQEYQTETALIVCFFPPLSCYLTTALSLYLGAVK